MSVASSTNPSVSPAQTLIDQEILKLEESIRKLKTLRNKHSDVAKLPQEVLGAIFFIVANSPESHRLLHDVFPAPALRFNFSFVCQQWREVSIGTPNIWSFVSDNCPPDWTRTLVERSRMTKLIFHAKTDHIHTLKGRGMDSTRTKVIQQALQDHFHRVQELKLSISIDDPQMFWDSFAHSAPFLRTLNIEGRSYSPRLLEIPGKGLQGVRLFSLETKACRLDWQSSLLTCLRHLKIVDSVAPSGTEFLEALRRMPHLVTLDLNDIPHFDPQVIAPTITLAHLELLRVSSGAHSVAYFLRSLKTPKDLNLDFACYGHATTSTEGAELLNNLVASFNQFYLSMTREDGKNSDFDELQLIRHSEDEVELRAWRTPGQRGSFADRKDESSFRVVMEWLLPGDTLMEHLIFLNPISKLSTLSLCQSMDIGPDALGASFGQLPTLNTLIVDSYSCSGALRALTLLPSNSAHNRPPFANLQVLCLGNVDFSNNRTRSLQDCLIQRIEIDVPVSKLIISDCYKLSKEDISSLREIVADVEWDDSKGDGEDLPFDVLYPYGYMGYGYDSD